MEVEGSNSSVALVTETPRRSRLVDLPVDCLHRLSSMMHNATNLQLVRAGDRLFAAKWAVGFKKLACYPTAWRTHALCKWRKEKKMKENGRKRKGREEKKKDGSIVRGKVVTLCLFSQLQSLHLQSRNSHQPLNRKEIELLPESLTSLRMQIRKNACDSKFPPNLTHLGLREVPPDFDPLYPLPPNIQSLGLSYVLYCNHTRLPKHLVELKKLTKLYLGTSGALTEEQLSKMPPSILHLDLARGCFQSQSSLEALAKFLPNLTFLNCERIFASNYSNREDGFDISVLPQSITRLPFAFGVRCGQEKWHMIPRQLKSFENWPITVHASYNEAGQKVKNDTEDNMEHIPPRYESIKLCGVTTTCPLRFVTRLCISSPLTSTICIIKQQQIEACKYMTSVTHLSLEGTLERDVSLNVPLTDVSVCTWRLQSLELKSHGGYVVDDLHFNDYVPWITHSMKVLVVRCSDLIANEDTILPSSILRPEFQVLKKFEDSKAPKSLRKFITFIDPASWFLR